MIKKKTPLDYLYGLINLGGVKAVTVIGRDGFVIECAAIKNIDLEALGAVVSTGFGASEVMGEEILLGNLGHTIMEYLDGKILTSPCGSDAILAVVTNNDAILGSVRHNMQKVASELDEII